MPSVCSQLLFIIAELENIVEHCFCNILAAVKPDCSIVKCAAPLCDEGYEPFTPPGQCCPTGCKKVRQTKVNCIDVFCIQVVCEPGQTTIIPDGKCCPMCVTPVAKRAAEVAELPPIDCAAVLCLALGPDDCNGETPVVPPGECCARCPQRDCSAVSCLKPVCKEGKTLEVPDGECCPVCVPNGKCVFDTVSTSCIV